MIIEIISEYKRVAFYTTSTKRLIDLCISEGITFSKTGFKDDVYISVNFGDRLKDRVAYERGDNVYKVIIEKI